MPKATAIRFEEDRVVFALTNGGELAFPLTDFPRLRNATPEQRAQGKLVWGWCWCR
ncbi:DUF2442 domain-containing protein [Sulfobacillus thermotolerans]|uniref:DUF2442 domain-containing protein n=1 Tax=Sulfobacillus thermotolerans TaxID=338644 RepID=UPI003D2FD081